MEPNDRRPRGPFRDPDHWPPELKLEWLRRRYFLIQLGHDPRHAEKLATEQLRPLHLGWGRR